MRVIHFSTSHNNGGAALAASELAETLNKRISSRLVTQNRSGNLLVEIIIGIKRKGSRLLSFFDPNSRQVYTSYAVFSSRLRGLLRKDHADIIHLHWVQGEFLSVEDIGKANAPVVWTLHDGWQFLNGPHHDSRYLSEQILKDNGEKTSIVSRWMKQRKLRSWTKKMYLVAPSQWIADQAMKADVNKNNIVTVIPNIINRQVFYKRSKSEAREELGLGHDCKLILVGSLARTADPIKGFDLLIKALKYLSKKQFKFKCLYIGKEVDVPEIREYAYSMGSTKSRERMALVYAASDVVCVPSRIETHSMVAAEAISCGRPVAAFDVGGNREIIKHKKSGYLSEPFNIESLARGILFCIEQLDGIVSDDIYRMHCNKHDPDLIIDQYIKIYSEIMN